MDGIGRSKAWSDIFASTCKEKSTVNNECIVQTETDWELPVKKGGSFSNISR